jgi:LacI family transcriptional regulator
VAGDPGDFQAAGERFLLKAMAQRSGPMGLFVMHPMAAGGVLLACRREGLRIPEDVGVLTSDVFTFNELLATPMSSLRQSTQRMGQIAALMLRDMIEGRVPVHALQRAELDVELIPGASTALLEGAVPPMR